MKHTPVKNIEHRSGWEKTLDKKLAARDRKRFNARLFCIMYRQGKAAEWTPYRGRQQAEQALAKRGITRP